MSTIFNRIKRVIRTEDLRILQAPPKLFNPYRILIMKILSLHGLAEFREMKYTLKLSDGNLSSHLRALEEEGYVIPHKEFVGKRVRTTYELTSLGRSKFEEFVNQMQSVLA